MKALKNGLKDGYLTFNSQTNIIYIIQNISQDFSGG